MMTELLVFMAGWLTGVVGVLVSIVVAARRRKRNPLW